jgi:hypothetical protein
MGIAPTSHANFIRPDIPAADLERQRVQHAATTLPVVAIRHTITLPETAVNDAAASAQVAHADPELAIPMRHIAARLLTEVLANPRADTGAAAIGSPSFGALVN